MRVLLKMMVGNCSTLRKSGDFRCASRRASLVIKEWASIVASTEESVKSSSLRSIDTRTPVKCPFTVMRPMCLAENSTWVCIGSTLQLMCVLLGGAKLCADNSCEAYYRQAYRSVMNCPRHKQSSRFGR